MRPTTPPDGRAAATRSSAQHDALVHTRLAAISTELLAVLDRDARLREVSPSWTRTLGWSGTQLVDQRLEALLHPDDLAATSAAFAATSAARPVTVLNRVRHRDGGYRWLRWTLQADTDSEVRYAAARDVTDERRRQVFGEQVERATGVGSWELDPDTGQTHWSPLTRELHGLAPGDPVVLDDALASYTPEARANLEPALEALLDRGEPFDLILGFHPVGGGHRWVRATGQISTEDGRRVRVFGTFEDITEEHEERQWLRHLRELVELSQEGIIELDSRGRVLFANRRTGILLGIDRDRLLGRRVTDLLVGDASPARFRWISLLRDDPEGLARGEERFRRPDGSLIWVQIAARATRDDHGRITRVSAIVTDISEQKRRQRQLEEQRFQLEQAQHLARIGHWEAELDTGGLHWSPVIYDIVGVDRASFEPTVDRYFALVHPDDRARLVRFEDLADGRSQHELTYRVVRPDGEERTLHELAQGELDSDGRLVRIVGTLQDITEQARAAAAVEEREALLARVLTATNDGWWESELRTGRARVSNRWYEIHGYEPDALPLTPQTWQRVIHPDEQDTVLAELASHLDARHATFTLRTRILHRAGHDVPVTIRVLAEYDETGAVRLSGATTDITEIQHAEAVKEEFISTVSHELRTPLTSIGGVVELLRHTDPGLLGGDTTTTLLEVAERNTERLRSLIDDLLDAEQLMTGRAVFHRTCEPLRPLLVRAIEDNQHYDTARAIRFALVDPIPALDVEVDASRIAQVLANFLSNAAKYAPTGSTVEIHAHRHGPAVRTEVVDVGEGVPEGFEHRLFQRFQQADPTDARSRGGTGLGLAISREIVEQHGGRVGYHSRVGRTSFWFDLPIAEAPSLSTDEGS